MLPQVLMPIPTESALPAPGIPWAGSSYEPRRFSFDSLGMVCEPAATSSKEDGAHEVLRALLLDGLVLVTGLPRADEVAAAWNLTRALFDPASSTNVSFYESRGVTHDAHYNTFTGVSDLAEGFTASYGLGELPLHTDGAYLATPPRVKVLAPTAIEGEIPWNTFADGWQALGTALNASELSTLAHVPLTQRFTNSPAEATMEFRRAALGRDGDGRPHVAWNAYSPDSEVPAEGSALGAARARLEQFLGRPGAALRVRLPVGTVAIMDNWRVLHGREAMVGTRRVLSSVDLSDDALHKRWGELNVGVAEVHDPQVEAHLDSPSERDLYDVV